MKHDIKIYFRLFVCFTLFGLTACTDDITEGYLSDEARYEANPFIVKQGQIKSSIPLSTNGSTSPIHVKLLEVRNVATGEIADELLKPYPTNVWKGGYNPETDTTYELLLENKISTSDLPILSIDEIGGRIKMTGETSRIEPGEYEIDIEVSNSAGSYVIKNACNIIIESGVSYQLNWRESFFTNANEMSGWIWRPLEYEVNEYPDQPNRLVLKWADKNGNFFNPKKGEVVGGWKETWRHTFDEYTPWGFELTDDSMIFNYPFPSFPNEDRVFSYRIPTRYIGATFNDPALFDGKDYNTRLHVLRVHYNGTFEFVFKCDDIERVAQ